jgi:hypothetical protein
MAEQTFGEMLEMYRRQYDTDKAILLRPNNYNFVQSDRDEMAACLDEIEKLALLGEKASPLQQLAMELVIPGALRNMREEQMKRKLEGLK